MPHLGARLEALCSSALPGRGGTGHQAPQPLPQGVRARAPPPSPPPPPPVPTQVTVWGAGFRDLDHGGGLSCKFGAASLVPATLASDAGDGGQSLTCAPPPHLGCVGACESVAVGRHAKRAVLALPQPTALGPLGADPSGS